MQPDLAGDLQQAQAVVAVGHEDHVVDVLVVQEARRRLQRLPRGAALDLLADGRVGDTVGAEVVVPGGGLGVAVALAAPAGDHHHRREAPAVQLQGVREAGLEHRRGAAVVLGCASTITAWAFGADGDRGIVTMEVCTTCTKVMPDVADHHDDAHHQSPQQAAGPRPPASPSGRVVALSTGTDDSVTTGGRGPNAGGRACDRGRAARAPRTAAGRHACRWSPRGSGPASWRAAGCPRC